MLMHSTRRRSRCRQLALVLDRKAAAEITNEALTQRGVRSREKHVVHPDACLQHARDKAIPNYERK